MKVFSKGQGSLFTNVFPTFTGQRTQDSQRLREVRGQLHRGQGQIRGAIREGEDREKARRLQGQISESLQVTQFTYSIRKLLFLQSVLWI